MKKSNRRAKISRSKTVLHILTGSIAAYKACDLIGPLKKLGARVVCIMTDSAKEFITPLTLRALTGEKVFFDFFTADVPYNVQHISLADDADLILVAPASANFIARLAAGFANDLASCVILSASCPVVIAPAMNDHMYEHPITQENIRKLQKVGYHFVEPIVGDLACGKKAVGHIADTSQIIATVQKLLS